MVCCDFTSHSLNLFLLRKENLATQTDRDAGPHKRLPQSKARKRKGTAKPQWAGAMRGRNSQRLPRRAAPAAGSRRVRHLVAERVRGSGRARPSECPRSSPRSLHVHVHVAIHTVSVKNVKMGMSTRHATNGARRRLQGHALDLGARSRCQFSSSRWPCSIHPGCSSCSCVLLQNEFFKKASTSTCAFMLPMDWVGIPMPRCSVNGACNLVRVRAIRFPPLRHWPRCGCSAQALAGFITAGLLPPLQFVVGSKMVNAGRRPIAGRAGLCHPQIVAHGGRSEEGWRVVYWGEAAFTARR